MNPPTRSGFVSLVGHPNVGKSTLLNRMVGSPISITANKPQTTRNRIMGVKTEAGLQIVFVDTPGIHEAADALGSRLVRYATKSLQDTDLILLLVEPFAAGMSTPPTEQRIVLDKVAQAGAASLLAINKIDLHREKEVLETIAWYGKSNIFSEIVPVSALHGQGVERLERVIPTYLTEGPFYFDPGQTTDQREEMMVAELVRQEVFRRLRQEVPYSTAVRGVEMEEGKNLLSIRAEIVVERDSQKGILIGKGGKMLKAIGRAARLKIETLLGTRVYLDLHVSVLKDWSENPRYLTELGYPDI